MIVMKFMDCHDPSIVMTLPSEPTSPVRNGSSSNTGKQVQEGTITTGHLFCGRGIRAYRN